MKIKIGNKSILRVLEEMVSLAERPWHVLDMLRFMLATSWVEKFPLFVF